MLGKIKSVAINIELIPVPNALANGYFKDDSKKLEFQEWVNSLWQEKDKLIAKLHKELNTI